MRRSLAVLACLLTATACSSTSGTGDSEDAGAPQPEGSLLALAESADLGFAETGGGPRLQLAGADSSGQPVLLGTATGGTPSLARGTDLAGTPALAALGEYGSVAAMAVAPDDTVVLLGLAAVGPDESAPAVVRVTADGTESVLPITGTADDSPVRLSAYDAAFSPDASRAVVAVAPRDTSQGFPEDTGELSLVVLDTTTGAQVAATQVPLAERAAVIPGSDEVVRVDDVAVAADGSVIAAVSVAGQSGSRLLRLDPSLAPVGEPAELPRLEDAGGFLGLAPDGTAYLTTTGSAVALARVPVGGTASEEVATVQDGPGGLSGMVLDPTGTWAYLAGVTDLDLGQTVRGVELATGEVTAGTQLCAEGFLDEPAIDVGGAALVVPGTCNEPTLLEAFAYVLTA